MIAVPFPSPFDLELSAIEASCWEWSSEGTGNGRHDDWGANRRAMGTDGRKCEVKKGREEPRRVFVPAQPLGDGRGEHMGGAGAWGSDSAQTESKSAVAGGWREGCRRDWRAHCPAEARAGSAVSVTGAAALRHTTPYCAR